MHGLDILRMQLRGSCDLVESHARETSAAEWTDQVLPGTSAPGFILWHCARIIDWGVNTVVRDGVELGAGAAWAQKIRYDLGHGAGLTDEQAEAAARTVTADGVAEYASALKTATLDWLDGVGGDDLDRVPDLREACRRHPMYSSEAAWAEVASLEGVPAWQVLARPCISHIRVHIGELEVLLRQSRSRAGVTA